MSIRILSALLLLSVTFSIVGCGGVDNTAVAPENPVPPPTTPPTHAPATTSSEKIP